MFTERDLANWIIESHALKGETLIESKLASKVAEMKKQIMDEKDKLTDFTWHHHQETGRVELIPRWIHDTVKHSGGNSIWPRNPLIKGR